MAGASVVATGRWNSGNLRRGAQQDLGFLQQQANGFGKSMMSSFTGIGAAMGGIFAASAMVDFFKQSAQAAMEDEKSMVALATAMDNVGLSAQNAQAEDLIQSMMLQTGIADDQLRPAYQKLVTVTKNVTEAQGLLQTALDLSAAGYGDLTATSKALSAAANGNFTALQRLKVPIDQAALASKDFDAAVASLNKTVGGQAAAAAQTYSGQMSRLTVAVGEAQEAIGYALLRSLDDVSKAMGGTGGIQSVILKTGDTLSLFIDDVSSTYRELGKLTSGLISLATFGLIPASKQGDLFGDTLQFMLDDILAILGGPLYLLSKGLRELGLTSDDSTDATKALTSATVASAVAAGKASNAIGDLGDETDIAAGKAWDGTQSYLAFAESLVLAQRAARDFGNTSATVQGAIAEGAQMGGVPGYWKQIQQAYGEVERTARGAAGGTRELTKAQQDAKKPADELRQNTDDLAKSLRGLITEVTGPITTMGVATFDSINAQVEKFKSTLAEARNFAQGVVDSFMGQLSLGDALDKAKETGSTLVEAFVSQGDKVKEFGAKIRTLMAAGLSKPAWEAIMGLGYQRGSEVADALIQGNIDENVASVNKVYESVKTMAEQIAEAAASAFYKAGLDLIFKLISAMVEDLGLGGKGRKRIMALMDELAASMSRSTTIFVAVSGPGAASGSEWASAMAGYTGPVFEPGFSLDFSGIDLSGLGAGGMGFADGGIAMQATPGVFGEAGPEALIPLDRLGDFGGNTYQITVQAGVGDPRAIGKSVVEAITLFERSSGPVFARA